MENQHRKITGYRELAGNDIDDMNGVKQQIGKVLEYLVYLKQPGNGYDPRCLAIGATKLEEAEMCLCRAIAQPENMVRPG